MISSNTYTDYRRRGLFHITGTDIVRCLAFRFQAFGRPVKNIKKFEEGIFSDLRNLKAGTDAALEDPKSPFLDFLFKNNCIRTQKKQKVFYWYSVPHDRLFLDALERDLKREKADQESTSAAEAEPALSFEYDASQSLYEQISKMTEGHPYASGNGVDERESIPPPQTVPRASSHFPDDTLNDSSLYSQTAMPAAAVHMMTTNPRMISTTVDPNSAIPLPEPAFGPISTPLAITSTSTPPQNSAPTFVEYSPAPSYMSSQSYYEDSTTRGISYEPMTPPQHLIHGPINYGPSELYAIPNGYQGYGLTAVPAQYGAVRNTPISAHQMRSGGSPILVQRRQSEVRYAPYPMDNKPTPGGRFPRRTSDLRRSISTASVPPPEVSQRTVSGTSVSDFNNSPVQSRGGTPLGTIEEIMAMSQMKQRYQNMMRDNGYG